MQGSACTSLKSIAALLISNPKQDTALSSALSMQVKYKDVKHTFHHGMTLFRHSVVSMAE